MEEQKPLSEMNKTELQSTMYEQICILEQIKQNMEMIRQALSNLSVKENGIKFQEKDNA